MSLLDQISDAIQFVDKHKTEDPDSWDFCESVRERLCAMMQTLISMPLTTSMSISLPSNLGKNNEEDYPDVKALLHS